MNTNLNEYFKLHHAFDHGYGKLAPKIECVDGFKMSVQASETHYCSPRENEGPYTEVECGFPESAISDALLEYAEKPSKPLETIYPYVPIEIVEAELALHGGIK